MKKVSVIFVAVLLVAVSVFSVFAAGINSNEQKLLDTFKKSVKMQGTDMYWPDEFVNQAENYFNTIDMTAGEANRYIDLCEDVKKQLESSGAKNIADCTYEQKQELLKTLQEGMAAAGGTATYDKTTKEVTLKDKDGKVIFKAVPTLVAKDTQLGVGVDGQKTDGGVIKTTGAAVDTTVLVVVGAVVVLAIAGGVFFVVKKRKA